MRNFCAERLRRTFPPPPIICFPSAPYFPSCSVEPQCALCAPCQVSGALHLPLLPYYSSSSLPSFPAFLPALSSPPKPLHSTSYSARQRQDNKPFAFKLCLSGLNRRGWGGGEGGGGLDVVVQHATRFAVEKNREKEEGKGEGLRVAFIFIFKMK